MTDVRQEEWYKHPFEWYEKMNKPELYGVRLTEVVALDFMQGLYDIYQSFKTGNKQKAMHDAEVLATLLIASSLNVGEEVVQELLSDEFNTIDVDDAVERLMNGEYDD